MLLYFLNTDNDGDLGNPNNWWDTSDISGTSGYTPTASDDVFILSSVSTGTLYSSTCTLQTGATINNCTISGSTVTFEGSSSSTSPQSTISGNVVATDTASLSELNIIGDLTLNSTSTCSGTCSISGSITANNSSSFSASNNNVGDNIYTFNDSSTYSGYINLSASSTFAFNDTSIFSGTIDNLNNSSETAISFYDSSTSSGNITSTYIAVNYPVSLPLGGTISGTIKYFGYSDWYFNGTGDWSSLSNWWMNSAHTAQATQLPQSNSNVIATSSITSNSMSESTSINSFTISGSGNYNSIEITINNCAGAATFNDNTSNAGTINGCGTFPQPSATFNDSSTNSGTLNDLAVIVVYPNTNVPIGGTLINSSATYSGYPTRTLYFYGGSDWSTLSNWWTDSDFTTQASWLPLAQDSAVIETNIASNSGPTAKISGIDINNSTISIEFEAYSAIFNNNSSYNGIGLYITSGSPSSNNPIFNDYSSNSGAIYSNQTTTFNDYSTNTGSINPYGSNPGDVNVYYPVSIPIGGTISGSINYFNYTKRFYDPIDGNWDNPSGNIWFLDAAHTIVTTVPSATFPGENIILDSSLLTYSFTGPACFDLSTSVSAQIDTSLTCYGLVTLSNTSYISSNGNISGNVLFTDTSYISPSGTISGTGTFKLSAAESTINQMSTIGDIEFSYSIGINGSSILGLP